MVAPDVNRTRIAVLNGGPLDGREYPMHGPPPPGARRVVPGMFCVMEGPQGLLMYELMGEGSSPDGVRYMYQWSHALAQAED
jgi:hypothetical protein